MGAQITCVRCFLGRIGRKLFTNEVLNPVPRLGESTTPLQTLPTPQLSTHTLDKVRIPFIPCYINYFRNHNVTGARFFRLIGVDNTADFYVAPGKTFTKAYDVNRKGYWTLFVEFPGDRYAKVGDSYKLVGQMSFAVASENNLS